MKKVLPWILVIIPAFVFLQSLPFKFNGAVETQHIFGTIGHWFGTLGATTLGELFGAVGAIIIGSFEAIAAVLLLIPASRIWGAALGSGLLSGALFFHLFTPLGIAVKFPNGEHADPTLFVLAVVAFLCCVFTLFRERRKLPFVH